MRDSDVAFSGPMPSSRSPHGIQFDSPLQRQWMILLVEREDGLESGDGLGRQLLLQAGEETEVAWR